MSDRAWKRHERVTAKRLHGRRVGPQGKEGNDVDHPLFGIECKERREVVKWIEDALEQSRSASRPGQLPIVVLHWLGQRHDDDVVLIRLSDFEQWAGSIETPREVTS